MPHNDYTNVGGLWPSSVVPTPDAMRRLDQAASECIDGDNGGTWTPSSPIIIGGAGVSLLNNVAVSGAVSGPRAAAGGGIILSSQFLSVVPARTRTTVVALRDFLTRLDENVAIYNELGGGVSAFAGTTFSCPLPSQRIHRNFTPLSVTLRMRVTARPAAVPTSMPGFVITRIPATGSWISGTNEYYQIPTRANSTAYALGALVLPTVANGTQFRCIVAGTTAAAQPAGVTTGTVNFTAVTDGSVSWRCETGPAAANSSHVVTLARPATVDAYFNQGAFQDITFIPNANGPWDSANYGHSITVTDPSGTLNAFHSVRMAWSVTAAEPLL